MKDVIANIIAELTRFVFAMALMGLNAGVLYWVLVRGTPDASKELTMMIVNMTGTAAGFAISYYFGSSAGSAAKDRAMADAAAKPKP